MLQTCSNPIFICTRTEDHRFKSDTRHVSLNDRLELAPCPTCGAELRVSSLMEQLMANVHDEDPEFAAGLVIATDHPNDARKRMWDEFVADIAIRE